MRPRFYQGERARVRISRGAQSCETSKESNRFRIKYAASKEFWHKNRGIPRGVRGKGRALRSGVSVIWCFFSRVIYQPAVASRGGASSVGYLGFLCQNRSFPVYFSERQGAPMPRIPQSSHNNSWGWVSLLVAWNVPIRSILLACDFVKASQCIAIVTKEEDVMCFRPPDTTSGPLICPECGKKIVSPNFRPVNCPFCKAPLPPEGAPAAPSAGGAPVALGAPTVPGAPKPPSGK